MERDALRMEAARVQEESFALRARRRREPRSRAEQPPSRAKVMAVKDSSSKSSEALKSAAIWLKMNEEKGE